jgi:stage IV sporulation protein B
VGLLKLLKGKYKFICLAIILVIGYFSLQCFFELITLPRKLKIIPGQKMTLSVHYPLSFYTNKEGKLRQPVGGSKLPPLIANKLTLSYKKTKNFNVELRIFGKIPVKELHVEVSNPPLIVPGGQAIGVLFSSQGVVVVGHLPIKGIDQKIHYPAKEAGIQIGDILIAINNTPVNRVEDVETFLKYYQQVDGFLNLSLKHHGMIKTIKIKPILCSPGKNGQLRRYMLGIFIEDPAAGVGTLSFYDPHSRRFAGLGHRIAELPGSKGLILQQGEIVLASINGIRLGLPGQPGEKIGFCNLSLGSIGQIDRNSKFGIYGKLNTNFQESAKPLPVAFSSQVKTGPAEIYTVIKGNKVEHFQIEIIKVFRQDLPRDKGLILKVTDPLLLKQTGGIIQGMSGSPIIQEGRLVGAVTHVFVNDPTKGYGVLAEWMIQEMNAVNAKKAS